jgi:8-oxo-dGTP pyrophosphatase MutT (NUDIX family)
MYPALRERMHARLRAGLDPDPRAKPGPATRIAAVLLPVIDGPDPGMVFTRRTDDLPRHPGEISFPGGMQEESDADAREAALREAEEELGIDPRAVEMLGALPPVHTVVSAILIVPFVGMLWERPRFRPDVGEIAEVLEFPVSRLLEAEAPVEWPIGDQVYRGFAYELDGNTIWGATAAILHGFLDTVRG